MVPLSRLANPVIINHASISLVPVSSCPDRNMFRRIPIRYPTPLNSKRRYGQYCMSNAINEIDNAIDEFYNSERRLLIDTLERQKDSIREAALNEVKSAEICLKDEDYAGSAFHIMMANAYRDYYRTLEWQNIQSNSSS